MEYKKETVKGVSWMGLLRGATRALAFVKIAVLARLLNPYEFGIFGIAALVLAFLEIITETGINIFLIQEKEDLEKYNDTAWVVSIFRGFIIAIFLFILSPFIAQFFHSSGATKVIALMALVPLIRGFINPAIVRFQKELQFSKEFILRFSIYSIDGIVAIVVGLLTHSASSMVWGMIAGGIVEVILSHLIIKPRPIFVFHKERIKEVFNRGKWITIAGFFNYLFENLDDMVVGRIMLAFDLGVYQMAYKISSLPISEIADVVTKVTFPVFVKISYDKERLKRAFLKTILGISLLVIPFGFILLFFTEPIVKFVLGQEWLIAVPVIKTLSFLGVVRALISSSYPLFLATKNQKYATYITLFGILGLGITIYPFVLKYGLIGAGFSALVGAIFTLPITFYFVLKLFRELK